MLKQLFIAIVIFAIKPVNTTAQPLVQKDLQQSLQLLQKSKADTNKVELLLKLGQHYILKTGEEKPDMDSAAMLLQNALTLSRQLLYNKGITGYYLYQATMTREKGERAVGRQLTDSAILLSKKYNQFNLLGDAYIELKQYYNWQEDNERVIMIDCFEKALTAFRQSGNIEKQAFSLQNLADLNQISENIPLSINQAKQALNLYSSIGYPNLQGVYDLLNLDYSRIADYPSAIKYGLLAVQTVEKSQDTTMQLCTVYYRLGLTFSRSKTNPDSVLAYYQKALAVAEKHNQLKSIYVISPGIVYHYFTSNQLGKALEFALYITRKYPVPADDLYLQLAYNRILLVGYTVVRNKTEAQKYCNRMLDIYKNPKADPRYARLDLVRFFLVAKQYDNAEASLKIHDKIFENGYWDADQYFYNRHFWFGLDSARGNYLSAISYLQQQKKVQDSVFSENKSKIIETLRIEYETDKKDKDLKLKNKSIESLTQQSELQKNEIQRSRLLRIITLAGIFILIVFLSLLYTQFRQKQKANKEINEKNMVLRHLVEEKEWLLKEVHHRVKNNLQTVVSLLESQSAYLQNDALLAIQDSQNRVHTMSLIHQKLYQNENVAAINMAEYLPELVTYLRDSFNTKQQIHFNLQIDPIELDVSQAVPVGLILNEAITNAIKYAFLQKNTNCTITINMAQNTGNKVMLIITDNGIGLPADIADTKHTGLGLRLMKGLTQDLDGQFLIQSNDGTAISISFTANTPLSKSDEASFTKLISNSV